MGDVLDRLTKCVVSQHRLQNELMGLMVRKSNCFLPLFFCQIRFFPGRSGTKCLRTLLLTLAQTGGEPGISAFPDGDNIFHWKGTLEGAEGTVSAHAI